MIRVNRDRWVLTMWRKSAIFFRGMICSRASWSWTGHQFRHSPQRVQASSWINREAERLERGISRAASGCASTSVRQAGRMRPRRGGWNVGFNRNFFHHSISSVPNWSEKSIKNIFPASAMMCFSRASRPAKKISLSAYVCGKKSVFLLILRHQAQGRHENMLQFPERQVGHQ